MSDREQVHVKVDSRTKKLAKDRLGHGGISELVRTELQRVAHGEEATERERIKSQLAELREKREGLTSERNRINDKLDDIERRIERAEDQLDSIRDKQGEYEGALQVIEQQMAEEGHHVFEGHGQIKDAAEMADCEPADVIEDLKERNPDLPPEQFKQKLAQ